MNQANQILMTTKLASASFEMGIRAEPGAQPSATATRDRFNIVLLGDFTGRANRKLSEPMPGRRAFPVNIDNFETVFARLDVNLNLPLPATVGGPVELTFTSLDDFHPDNLIRQVPALAAVADAWRLLRDPKTATRGKEALQAILSASVSRASPSAPDAQAKISESDADTMARLLGGTAPIPEKSPAAASRLDQFIQQIVSPHVTPDAASWQPAAVAAAEMELAERLQAILHHPDFQSLEAAWRAADLLVRRVESAETIGLFLLDDSRSDVQRDLESSEATEQSALFRTLRDLQPSLIVGNFTFAPTPSDLQNLSKLARIAAALKSAFVATAAPEFAGCDSFARHPDPDDWKIRLPADCARIWETLRKSPVARHLGLTAPRYLVRQPYGKTGDAIETFAFDELPGGPAHESFLWGHSGNLVAGMVIDALQSGDPDLANFTGGEISDLPVHKFTEDGEVVVKCYAEAWLTDRAVDRLLTLGLLPVVPIKNQNAIRVNHLRSIAQPPANLPLG